MAENTRNHIFSKEISQVIIAAMVLAPNFYCKNCLRVISAMRGNPPLVFQIRVLESYWVAVRRTYVFTLQEVEKI